MATEPLTSADLDRMATDAEKLTKSVEQASAATRRLGLAMAKAASAVVKFGRAAEKIKLPRPWLWVFDIKRKGKVLFAIEVEGESCD